MPEPTLLRRNGVPVAAGRADIASGQVQLSAKLDTLLQRQQAALDAITQAEAQVILGVTSAHCISQPLTICWACLNGSGSSHQGTVRKASKCPHRPEVVCGPTARNHQPCNPEQPHQRLSGMHQLQS